VTDDDRQELAEGPGRERSLVRIWIGANGKRQWSVSVRAGDTPEELASAYTIAREIEERLASPPAPG
jgi:hypothetical protein